MKRFKTSTMAMAKAFAVGLPLALAALALTLGGCGDAGSGGGAGGAASSSEPQSTLRIFMTDAPFPLDDVVDAWVEVERIDIRMVDGEFEELISFDDKQIDLVQLQNGVTELLYEGSPPVGDYDALRIIVHPLYITILESDGEGGEEEGIYEEFKVPSGPQTGIKVFIDPVITVVTSLTKDLMLDFDLGRSFVAQGNPNTPAGIKSFHFKPVIRATNVSTAGTLTFRTLSDNGTPEIFDDDFYLNGVVYDVVDTSVDPEEVVASGMSGDKPGSDPVMSGYVFHPAIPAGEYEVRLMRDGYDGYTDVATIWIANLTDLGEITLAANEAVISGTVTSTRPDGNNRGIGDVTVSALPIGEGSIPNFVLTDVFGDYTLMFIPPIAELYDVFANKDGYEEATAQAQPAVSGEDATVVDLELIPLTADLVVSVTDGTDLIPDLTVNVYLHGATDFLMGSQTTIADAPVVFAALPTDTYDVEVVDTDTTELLSTQVHSHLGGFGPVELEVVLELAP